MDTYPHKAKTFLREAKDSLKRLRDAGDADDINRAMLTFLNATKHSIQQLQTDFRSKLAGFDEWYAPHKALLLKDEFCAFFWNARNRMTKAGEQIIKTTGFEMHINPNETSGPIQGPIKIGPDMGFSVLKSRGRAYEWEPQKNIPGIKLHTPWKFVDYPAGDAIKICEAYLAMLNSVVDSFIEDFAIPESPR